MLLVLLSFCIQFLKITSCGSRKSSNRTVLSNPFEPQMPFIVSSKLKPYELPPVLNSSKSKEETNFCNHPQKHHPNQHLNTGRNQLKSRISYEEINFLSTTFDYCNMLQLAHIKECNCKSQKISQKILINKDERRGSYYLWIDDFLMSVTNDKLDFNLISNVFLNLMQTIEKYNILTSFTIHTDQLFNTKAIFSKKSVFFKSKYDHTKRIGKISILNGKKVVKFKVLDNDEIEIISKYSVVLLNSFRIINVLGYFIPLDLVFPFYSQKTIFKVKFIS